MIFRLCLLSLLWMCILHFFSNLTRLFLVLGRRRFLPLFAVLHQDSMMKFLEHYFMWMWSLHLALYWYGCRVKWLSVLVVGFFHTVHSRYSMKKPLCAFYETLCVVISLDWFGEQHNRFYKIRHCDCLKVYSSFRMSIGRLIKKMSRSLYSLIRYRCGVSHVACSTLQVLWWIEIIPS